MPDLLASLCVAAVGAGRLRVVVDGAPSAAPELLADALVEPLRAAGVRTERVSADAFLRPASLRYEAGRTNADAFYDGWLDAGGLIREVLSPWGPGGCDRWVPALWDAASDRAARLAYRPVPAGPAVLIVDGSLLLGRGLPFDLAVHLRLSAAALRRRTTPDQTWTLPAYERYDEEVGPAQVADVVIRADHPDRPAVTVRA